MLRHCMRANFPPISVPGVFHAGHYVGLERISFLDQLFDALQIGTFDVGESLQISRLTARTRSPSLRREWDRINALALLPSVSLKGTHRLSADCFLDDTLQFHRRLFRSRLLIRRFHPGRSPF